MAKDKKESSSLDKKLEQINKLYGDNSCYVYKKGLSIEPVGIISTGSIRLNDSIGIGGVPQGRIIEIYGKESSGKTTLALHIISEAQKTGGIVAFIDAEHALDIRYAKRIGVKVDDVIISQPDYGEQALNIADHLIDTKSVGAIVIDSVAALVPKSEIDGEMGDAQMAVQARMMSQAMRKLAAKVHKSNTCLIFINQTRSKIGQVWGNPETTTGGNALKFYAAVRLEIKRIGSGKESGVETTNRTKVKVVKNKMSPPFKECEFDIRFGEGIDKYMELVDIAIETSIVKKRGAWLVYSDKLKWNGKEALRKDMVKREQLYLRLRKKITGE